MRFSRRGYAIPLEEGAHRADRIALRAIAFRDIQIRRATNGVAVVENTRNMVDLRRVQLLDQPQDQIVSFRTEELTRKRPCLCQQLS